MRSASGSAPSAITSRRPKRERDSARSAGAKRQQQLVANVFVEVTEVQRRLALVAQDLEYGGTTFFGDLHARFLQGKTVGEGFERIGQGVPFLARAALALTGRVADGWVPSLSWATPELVPAMQRRIDEGAEAPDFSLKDQHGQTVTLSDFRGQKNVLLVFYPWSFTGICTSSLKHAAHFKRNSTSGLGMVNQPTAGLDYHVPFGGRKKSSYGPREQGSYAKDFYTVLKTAYTAP